MKRISSIVGATVAIATAGALLAPAAGATVSDKNSTRGTLTVCVVGTGDDEVDVEANGPSDRNAELDNKECASWQVRKGTYTVSQDETSDDKVARAVVRGPGRHWDVSRDNEVRVTVKGGKTTTVVFMNHGDRERFRGFGGHCLWCHDEV